ncbi:MAG: DUF2281 domain-containing protein [Cyanobacteria bacterium J06627_28]
MSSLSEQIVQLVQTLSDEEQRQVLLFVEFLEHKQQRNTSTDSTFVQASQDVIQKRRDAYRELT